MLIPKKKGPAKAISLSRRVYERAKKFADSEGFTLTSVFETALEEFLDDREDDGSGDARPVRAVKS